MANLFLLVTIIVSTIFLLIGICVSFPLEQENPNQDDCKTNSHVLIVNATTGVVLRCHICAKHGCPEGFGLSIPCNGQNVSHTVNFECKPCVPGVNYSTGETVQCQSCVQKKCKDGEIVEGKCETTGDKRKCKKCELPNHYYNLTQKKCLPCMCVNMTDEIKQICKGLDINLICDEDKPSSTETPSTQTSSTQTSSNETPSAGQNDDNDTSDDKHVIIIIGVTVVGVLTFLVIFLLMRSRVSHARLSLFSKEWFEVMFCCKKTSRNHPHPPDVVNTHGQYGYHHGYVRQNSVPVTKKEKLAVPPNGECMSNGKHEENIQLLPQESECVMKSLKFFDMNSETCRQIEVMLMTNIDSGMGYVTLAGKMDFSANDVESFQPEPSKNMLKCWTSKGSSKNNVLKLKELVIECQRADIVELLDKELDIAKNKCGCRDCRS